MKPDIKLGYYKHFKGTVYQVFYIARDVSDENNWLVVYGNSFGDWVRPAKNFSEFVNVDGKTVPRFEYIGKELKP